METDTIVPVTIFNILFIILIILINAFLSAFEVSIGKLKSAVSQENEYENNYLTEKISANSEIYIMSIRFLKFFITLCTNIYFTVNYIYTFFKDTSFTDHSIIVVILIISLIMSCLLIAFGDIIPKKIALFSDTPPKAISLSIINIIYLLTFIIIKPLDFLINAMLKIFHKDKKDFDEKVSAEEIKALVETASEKGVFNDIEKEIINSIFSFDNITAKDIMVSRKDTYKIDITEPISEHLDEIIETYYSRIPVYKENIDDIIGILNTKDLLVQARKVGFENINIESLLQKPYFVPEMKNIDELFKEMQRLRNHMAILVDEYGGFSGIVTIEDLIEQIMGDINDEFDDEEQGIVKLSDDEYLISGTTEIREINKELDLELENENYDTISALVIEKLGYIPNKGEKPSIDIDNLTFKVELASDNRIQKVKLKINPIIEQVNE